MTSSKKECNFTRATICKRDSCDDESVWCPETNDVPREQIEFYFNYTIDVYMFEIQGRVLTNETVSHFLFQFLNESNVLTSKMFRTITNSSSRINKFMIEPPVRTSYIRITPIEYEVSIAMRFEIYSKGILYNQN